MGFWKFIYKYLSLARITNPLPIFLVIFPGFWTLTLSLKHSFNNNLINILYFYVAFLLGGILARGAGGVINDIADRKIDSQVARTQGRVLCSKQVHLVSAIAFAFILGLLSLAILFTFNNFTIYVGFLGAVGIIIYPFTKRFTYYPQIVLGFVFSWAALMGEASVNGSISFNTILLYLASVTWVIGYDSIYAIQDYKYDLSANIKSIVVALGERTQVVVGYLYLFTVAMLLLVGYLNHLSILYYLFILLVMLHFIWQVININIHRAKVAGTIFNYNIYVGLLVWIALLIG